MATATHRAAPREERVAWVLTRLGNGKELLYWEPILAGYFSLFPSMKIFTASYEGEREGLPYPVDLAGKLRRHYRMKQDSFKGGFATVGPGIVKRLFEYKPDLIIISEFGLLSAYVVVTRSLMRRPRILLLSEARPRLLGASWLNALRRIVRRFIARKADFILTNNIEGRDYLTEELHADPRRIITRPYLVSTLAPQAAADASQRPHELPARSNPDACVFVFSGRVIAAKGIDYAIDACGKLLSAGVTGFELWVIGDGPARPELEKRIQDTALAKHVSFFGQRPYDQLRYFLEAADVFLFPTLSDYRSLAVFEALSIGMPVLCSTENGGVREAVIDGENGFSFDPLDTDILADYMERLVQSPELRKRFAAKSTDLAKNFTLEVAVDSLYTASLAALESDHRSI